MRLWNVATGEIIQLIQDVGSIHRITFSVDGQFWETDAGTFLLEIAVPGSSVDISARTMSLELSSQWIRNRRSLEPLEDRN